VTANRSCVDECEDADDATSTIVATTPLLAFFSGQIHAEKAKCRLIVGFHADSSDSPLSRWSIMVSLAQATKQASKESRVHAFPRGFQC